METGEENRKREKGNRKENLPVSFLHFPFSGLLQ
jgi:hypothetical protein